MNLAELGTILLDNNMYYTATSSPDGWEKLVVPNTSIYVNELLAQEFEINYTYNDKFTGLRLIENTLKAKRGIVWEHLHLLNDHTGCHFNLESPIEVRNTYGHIEFPKAAITFDVPLPMEGNIYHIVEWRTERTVDFYIL